MTGKARDDAEALAREALTSPPLESRPPLQSGEPEVKGESLPPTSGARVVSAQPSFKASDPIAGSEPSAVTLTLADRFAYLHQSLRPRGLHTWCTVGTYPRPSDRRAARIRLI